MTTPAPATNVPTLVPTTNSTSPSLGTEIGDFFYDNKGLIVYFLVFTVYNLVLWRPWKKLPCRVLLASKTGEGMTVLARWPRVILGTKSPVTGIQSLRCTLQGSIFFATTALGLATFCLLIDEDRPQRRFIYVLIAVMFVVSVVCFSQQMRMVLHLNYFVMARPRAERTQLRPTALPKDALTSSKFGQDAIDYISHHEPSRIDTSTVTGANTPQRQTTVEGGGSTTSGAATTTAEHREFHAASPHVQQMQLEEAMDLDDEADRITYVLRRAVVNFSMGMRWMLYATPLIMGLIDADGYVLLATSLMMIPVLYYFDKVLIVEEKHDKQ